MSSGVKKNPITWHADSPNPPSGECIHVWKRGEKKGSVCGKGTYRGKLYCSSHKAEEPPSQPDESVLVNRFILLTHLNTRSSPRQATIIVDIGSKKSDAITNEELFSNAIEQWINLFNEEITIINKGIPNSADKICSEITPSTSSPDKNGSLHAVVILRISNVTQDLIRFNDDGVKIFFSKALGIEGISVCHSGGRILESA